MWVSSLPRIGDRTAGDAEADARCTLFRRMKSAEEAAGDERALAAVVMRRSGLADGPASASIGRGIIAADLSSAGDLLPLGGDGAGVDGEALTPVPRSSMGSASVKLVVKALVAP